jgi:exonuclease VII small subunit
MSLRTDLELALEGFRTTLKKLDNDIHHLEEALDIHLNGVQVPKRSDIEGLKAVGQVMGIPTKPIGELK